jgi:hypothetical protein
MSIQKTFYSSILFLLFTAGIYAQTLENKDSLAEESDIISDDKLKPLGDTTPVYIYYPLESQKLYKLDSSLNNFEYTEVGWNFIEKRKYLDLGHLGTAVFDIAGTPSIKSGFRTGLQAFDPYRLKIEDITLYKVGSDKPYTELFYSQINVQNVQLKAKFAHQATPNFYYGLHYGLVNYNGFFQGHRSRHQDISANFLYDKNNIRAHLIVINNAINQSENGGILDSVVQNSSTLFLASLPVRLNTQNDGSPKNENRHQSINFTISRTFNSVVNDSLNKSGKRVLSYLFNFENNNFKFFDKSPSIDSSFYGFFQTNNRGIRHFINHKVLQNEIHYKEAFLGDLNSSPLIFDVYLRHKLNLVNQEPQVSAINNLSLGAIVANQNKISLNYKLEANITTSSYGLDYFVKLNLDKKLKKIISFGTYLLYQKYEPELVSRKLFVTSTQVWDNNSTFNQVEEFFTAAYVSWDKFHGKIEISNNLIRDHIYFDQNILASQYQGQINIFRVKLNQDFHFWKFHLMNEIIWQKVNQGAEVFRIPNLILSHKLYFESPVFKTTLLRTGINLRYYSSFYANSYFPIFSAFHIQNNQNLSFYPIVDFFISAKIWQLKFFVNAENLSYLIVGNKNYFNSPFYPSANFFVRFGLSWQLFN